MEKQKIISILESLADGIDPASGEAFPGDSPYQNPDIVRALFHAVRMLNEEQPQAKKEGLPRSGKPWTEEEDGQLREAFLLDSNIKISQLARAHERTDGAIRSRLQKLGLLDPFGNRTDLH
jgi:hypothetical protein